MKKSKHKSKTSKLYQMLKEEGFAMDTLAGIQDAVKMLTKDFLQDALETELNHHLGYEKYSHEEDKNNYRNGSFPKTLKSSMGEIEISVPRDRNGEFEPQIVPKHTRDISEIEHKIIAMYSKGMSTRDISETIEEIYGFKVDATLVSKITDKVIDRIQEWRARPLEKEYAIIYIDGLRVKVRTENGAEERTVYVALAVDMEGQRDCLGYWIGESESSKYWLNVLNELKSRGVNDINIICCDNLKGISESIKAVFPKTEIQKCVVHQIRNSLLHISNEHMKEFALDMKAIYGAVSYEQAEIALEKFEEKWGKTYSYAVKSWRANFDELATFFKFPFEIRKMIYTTNIIENLNRNIRKIIKTKGVFTNENALIKLVYFAIENYLKKSTRKVYHWGKILSQLMLIKEEKENSEN